jgi:2'-5' RNA ligase
MSSQRIRLFTAFPVEIPESLNHALKRTRISAQQKQIDMNWIPESNFHITLNFIGDTERTGLAQLVETLNVVTTSTAPLSTSLRGMGGFPDNHHTRTMWVGVRKSRALRGFQEQLREALVAAGFAQEEREYTPHLTIGKTRKARSVADLISPHVRTQFGEVEVSSVYLYESVQTGSHPVYKILNSFSLTGSPNEDADDHDV